MEVALHNSLASRRTLSRDRRLMVVQRYNGWEKFQNNYLNMSLIESPPPIGGLLVNWELLESRRVAIKIEMR